MIPGVVRIALTDPAGSAALFGALIGVLGSLLVAVATGLLNKGKYRREMLWDKRQGACNEIVSRLQASAVFADSIREGFDEDAHVFYDSTQLRELNRKYGDEVSAAHKAYQSNYLLLPSAFRRRYERLEHERRGFWYWTVGPDEYLEPIAATERARRDLFDLARAELGIAPWWQRIVFRWRPGLSATRDAALRLSTNVQRWWRKRRKPTSEWDF